MAGHIGKCHSCKQLQAPQLFISSQGVNLGMIVKDASLFSPSGEGQHEVIVAINSLKEALKSDDQEAWMTHLQTIREQCDLDLGHRVLASSNGAYLATVDALMAAASVEGRMACLETLCALFNGQPDILTMPAMEHFFELLKQNQGEPNDKENQWLSARMQ